MPKKKGGKKPTGKGSRGTRKRRGRNIGLWILGAIVLAFVFYYIDSSGATETVNGVVVKMGTYDHGTRQGTHTHSEATVEFEGHRYTIRPASNLNLGDPVSVTVRRGRITGYPYFETAFRRQE